MTFKLRCFTRALCAAGNAETHLLRGTPVNLRLNASEMKPPFANSWKHTSKLLFEIFTLIFFTVFRFSRTHIQLERYNNTQSNFSLGHQPDSQMSGNV